MSSRLWFRAIAGLLLLLRGVVQLVGGAMGEYFLLFTCTKGVWNSSDEEGGCLLLSLGKVLSVDIACVGASWFMLSDSLLRGFPQWN